MGNKHDPIGALFFWTDEPHVTGYLQIGDEHYELAGVRRSKIRTDFKGKHTGTSKEPIQGDMFDDTSGSGG